MMIIIIIINKAKVVVGVYPSREKRKRKEKAGYIIPAN